MSAGSVEDDLRDLAVHVVIVNYNSSSLLGECLRSLSDEQITSCTVVDNRSSPRERRLVRTMEIAFPEFEFIYSEENLGFGGGVNRGLSGKPVSEQDFYWILNPDTKVEPGCLELLLHGARETDAHLLSPQITTGYGSDKRIWFAGGDLDVRRMRTIHHGYGSLAQGFCGLHRSTFLTGAALMVRADVWIALKGFDERYFLYWEDSDLCARALSIDSTLVTIRDAEVWHAVGGSGEAAGKSANYYYYMQRNRLIFARNMRSLHSCFVGAGFVETVRLLLRPFKQKHSRIEKARSSFAGLCAGLREVTRDIRDHRRSSK